MDTADALQRELSAARVRLAAQEEEMRSMLEEHEKKRGLADRRIHRLHQVLVELQQDEA